jgi:hypothetical protein
MATLTGPDWQTIAAAQKIELSEESAAKLAALWRGMLGLRGLVDWSETPIQVFQAGEPRQ